MATREDRIRKRLFPGVQTYEKDKGGFTILPVILRRCQFLFSAREWQVLTYILMRTGPSGVAWCTLQEMAWDLDFGSLPKLKPYVDKLVLDGWIIRQSSKGRDYYLAPDPIRVLSELRRKKEFPPERLEAIDELLELLKRSPLEVLPEDAPSLELAEKS